jgi:hypothetical protein
VGRGGLWFFVSFRIFFSDNTRVRIFYFFSPEFNIRLYDKNSESDYFFLPPPKPFSTRTIHNLEIVKFDSKNIQEHLEKLKDTKSSGPDKIHQ